VERAKQEAVNRRAREYLDFKMGGSTGAVVTYGINLDESQAVAPTLGRRADGSPLLYRGRVNTVFGPSESGKSWLSLYFVKQVLDDGGNVLVIDLEDDQAGFAHRLKTIGLDPAHTARLGYITGLTELGESSRLQMLTASRGTELVVVDSMDALLAIMGHDTNGAAGVRQAGSFLKKLAVNCDTAVLLVDHSTEKLQSGERANTQMGSSAKKQFIDGATLRADRLTVWAPNTECKTLIVIGKDRHGWAKANALFDRESTWGRAALLTMRPGWPEHTGSELRLENPPTFEEMPDGDGTQQHEAEDAIINYLRKEPGKWQPRTKVLQAAGDKNGRKGISGAAAALIAQGVIEERTVELRGGKQGIEYRYLPLDDEAA
jgi:KaiC/GvpD/RAD55 family RecA-like ATPase